MTRIGIYDQNEINRAYRDLVIAGAGGALIPVCFTLPRIHGKMLSFRTRARACLLCAWMLHIWWRTKYWLCSLSLLKWACFGCVWAQPMLTSNYTHNKSKLMHVHYTLLTVQTQIKASWLDYPSMHPSLVHCYLYFR